MNTVCTQSLRVLLISLVAMGFRPESEMVLRTAETQSLGYPTAPALDLMAEGLRQRSEDKIS